MQGTQLTIRHPCNNRGEAEIGPKSGCRDVSNGFKLQGMETGRTLGCENEYSRSWAEMPTQRNGNEGEPMDGEREYKVSTENQPEAQRNGRMMRSPRGEETNLPARLQGPYSNESALGSASRHPCALPTSHQGDSAELSLKVGRHE